MIFPFSLPPSVFFLAAGMLIIAAWPSDGLQQSPSQPETIGRVPHAIAVGDFNGDSIPDVAVPAAAERKVTVLLSNGRGGFAFNHSYPTGTGPSWVETGDFNGDQKLDLVTANTGEGDLSLYFGDGKGNFSKAHDITNVLGPASVVALDVNRDGRLDLAVTQPKESRIVILENLGGNFKASASYVVGRAPHIVTKADLNGDGIADLVVGTFARHMLSIFLAKGDGAFRVAGEIQVGRFPHYVAAGDWNRDGHQDLAVACAGEDAIILLQGDGTGLLRKMGTLPMGNNPHGLVAADFNGDGLVDLLYVPRNGDQLYFYWNSGDRDPSGLPIFVSAGHVSRQTSDWEACHALDLDSDHLMDVVVGRMWLRQRGMKDGLPDFAPIVTLDVGDVRCFFDVDGDGKYDAIIREPVAGDGLSNYRIAWQRNLGGTPPKFSSAKPLSDINRDDCSPAEVVAVNSGANSGLLVSSSPYSGFELFLKGKTTASFDRIGAAKSVSAVIALGDQASPCVCDWDGDGDLDLLVGDGYGYPRIVINDGNNEKPSYREARRILSGGKPIRLTRNEILDSHNWHDMGYPFPVFVDWDGDGLPDLMLPNETNRIFWHKNIGTRERPEFGPRQQVICDGFPDSPERRAKSGALADNRDTPNQPYPYEEDQPFFWRTGVAFADFDGDGLMDLVTDDGQHRQATLFVQYRDKSDQLKLRKESTLKLTDGRPIDQSLVQGSRGWAESFRATDWDGDGRIDLVYSIGGKPAGGSIQLLRNVGTRRAPVFDLPKAMCAFGQPINMTNHGPHPWVGDLDGDKLPDVLAYVEASVYCFFCHQAIEMSSPPSYSLRTWVTRERFTEKNISTSGVVKTQK